MILFTKMVLLNRQNESFTCVHRNKASAYFIVIARSPLLETLPIRSFKPFDLLLLAFDRFKILDFQILNDQPNFGLSVGYRGN